MSRAPTGPKLRFALESRIGITHDGLPQIIETVGGVMGQFVSEFCAVKGGLICLDQVGLDLS